MRCPACHNTGALRVLQTRSAMNVVWRRRECTGCEHRFNTVEIATKLHIPKEAWHPAQHADHALKD